MFLAKVTFGADRGDDNRRDALAIVAEDYLLSLVANGQIDLDYVLAWSNGQFVAYVNVPRPNSFRTRFHSRSGLEWLADVTKAFGREPLWRVIQDDVPKRFQSWRHSTFLYLSTVVTSSGPVHCGDTGSPIPAYLLPVADQTSENIDSWERHYELHDRLWLDSAALEIQAYKQLADPSSELSIGGRELCAEIERATGKPTYYYVVRYWGRATGEESRKCGLCGRKWRVTDTPSGKMPFHAFDFRCEPCRLVSHLADTVEDERHARIGEYKRRTR